MVRPEDHWHGAEAHERIARELYETAMGHAIDRSPIGSTNLIQRTALALLQSALLLASADNSYQRERLVKETWGIDPGEREDPDEG